MRTSSALEVVAGQTTVVAPLMLEQGVGCLSGVALLEFEESHGGIAVSVDGTAFATTTNANGSWQLDSVPAGPYYGAAFAWHTQAMTFPNVARERLETAIQFGNDGLDRGGDAYTHPEIGSVTAISMRVLLARSYYAIADYDEAQEIVDILDPNNTLEPSRPSYLNELLAAIEDLQELLQ